MDCSWHRMANKGLLILSIASAQVFAAATATPPETQSSHYQIISPESPVKFLAKGTPGFLTIEGKNATLTGEADLNSNILTGTFSVGLSSLDTSNELRNKHMKETYLKTQEFPTATLVLNPTTLSHSNPGEQKVNFTGMLKIKTDNKPVAGVLTLDLGSNKTKGSATFELAIDQYPSIGVPKYLGVTVANTVKVELEFTANKQTQAPAVAKQVEIKPEPKK